MPLRIRFGALASCVAAASLSLLTPAAAKADAPTLSTDPAPPAMAGPVVAQATAPAPYPYADTFKLHSLPGATRVIYLDFNGETIGNTQWNQSFGVGAFLAVGYDTDGNPASFSNGEMDVVQAVWQRVAEDFAPFAIDVTTEDPGAAAIDRSGASDVSYGTRALITNTNTILDTCGCGGAAWMRVYGMTSNHQFYQPALIFSKVIGGDKAIAEAVTHEVGHNMGLDHDGKGSDPYYTGAGVWAPIMGTAYYRPVTQFSKGEYSSATVTEDDFAVMQANGAPLRGDDYGDSTATAAAFPVSAGTAKGVITTDADVDVFSFVSGGGQQSFAASPAPKGPNLDIKLEMLDSGGAVLASNDPPSASSGGDNVTGMGASVTASTNAGATYYLRVQGVGAGDPATTGYSGYGSVGQYSLSGPTGTASSTPRLSVSDTVVTEGNSGTTAAAFTLSLSAPASVPVSVNVATSNNTAAANSDYIPTSATVTIPAGQTSATYSVSVIGDTVPEPHEKFSLSLFAASGATLGDATGFATIVNDDGVGISVNDVAKYEGRAGSLTYFTFTVTLSTKPVSPIAVTLRSANGSALAVSDYVAKTLTLKFAAGQRSKTVTVVVKGDAKKEASEQFYVNLSNPTGTGAKITDGRGIGTIKNDD